MKHFFSNLLNAHEIFGDFRFKTCSNIKVYSFVAYVILNYCPLNIKVAKEWIGLQREPVWFNGKGPTHGSGKLILIQALQLPAEVYPLQE